MPHNRYNNKSLLWMDAGNCQKDLKKFSKEEGKKGGGGCDACDERGNFEGCRYAGFLSVADVGTILPVVMKPRKPR